MSTWTYPLLFNKEDYNIYEEIKTYKSFLDMFLSQFIHWLPLHIPFFSAEFFIQMSSCESSVTFAKICQLNMDPSCLKTTLALSTPTIKDLNLLLWSNTHGIRNWAGQSCLRKVQMSSFCLQYIIMICFPPHGCEHWVCFNLLSLWLIRWVLLWREKY